VFDGAEGSEWSYSWEIWLKFRVVKMVKLVLLTGV